MKTQLTTLVIALIVGYIGGLSSQYFSADSTSDSLDTDNKNAIQSEPEANPFQIKPGPTDLNMQIKNLQHKVNQLEKQLHQLTEKQTSSTAEITETVHTVEKNNRPSQPVAPDKEHLIAAGVNADVADDILRRISQQDYRRLELQNLIRRDRNAAQPYMDELNELNKNQISLRTELGDTAYDQYLYSSEQNNRVKVSSVMAGSPAESVGFQKDDIILSYDEKKILSWQDIRSATLNGDINTYTNMVVLRDGMPINLMVPRGSLGVQLDPVLVDPTQ